nr:hypothetical protein [Rhodococcus sp. (in: high G+C Gram-positive bacteria)]
MNSSVAIPCAVVVTALAIVVLLGTGSARPAQTVTYSYDGETWNSALPTPLFDKDIRWVPGDRRGAVFHVFNDTDDDGRIQVLVHSDNSYFADALTVSIDGAASAEKCGVVMVGPHEKIIVGATVDMAFGAGNETQNALSDVDIVVQWDNRESVGCGLASGANDELEGTNS